MTERAFPLQEMLNEAMLTTMRIKNLAVIRELEVTFEKGFTVLTGETGAGKSILIDALQVILGGRGYKDMIRMGEDSMLIEAAFYFAPEKYVAAPLVPYLLDDTLIISREIFRDGRNLVKINGSLSNTAELRTLAPYLVSIHSQHDNQILFNSELHFRFLDRYAGNEELLLEYQECYQQYKEVCKTLAELQNRRAADKTRIDYLRFAVNEIEVADLLPKEEETLKDIKLLMKNQEKNRQNIAMATGALYENEESAYNCISAAEQALSNADDFEQEAERLHEMKYEIMELSEIVRNRMAEVETEYRDLNEIEDRLAVIYQLKQKYGGTMEGVFSFLEQARQELWQMEHAEEISHELEEQQEAYSIRLQTLGQTLSQKRAEYAPKLATELEQELHELMMPHARFLVSFIAEEGPCPYGYEKVEFFFSANLGMDAAPLHKIASGGEVSRVNLAMKSVLRGIDPACAFVFDEIDAGLSGRAAQKTGEKMYAISEDCQVLCVTHLPQIAAMADQHFLVSKEEIQGETVTAIHPVKQEERVSELARMMGGVTVTDLTRKNAEEILSLAQRLKWEQ